MKPEISVIMAAYNAAQFLDESIQSILNQTFQNFEFIIIDDCSTDNTSLIIKKYAAQDTRIVYYRNERNINALNSLIKAFNYSKGAYIARLDADDIALPHRLQTQYNYIQQNPNIALIGGGAEIISEDGIITGYKRPDENFDILKYQLLFRNPILHPALFFRKDAVIKAGGYDLDYIYAEDYALYCSLVGNGYRIGNVPEIIIKYRRHPRQLSTVSKSREIQMANTYRVNLDYINQYLPVSLDKVKKVIDTIYKKKSDIFSVLSTIIFCRRLTTAYIKKEKLNPQLQKSIWNLYTTDKKMLLRHMLRVHLSGPYAIVKKVLIFLPD